MIYLKNITTEQTARVAVPVTPDIEKDLFLALLGQVNLIFGDGNMDWSMSPGGSVLEFAITFGEGVEDGSYEYMLYQEELLPPLPDGTIPVKVLPIGEGVCVIGDFEPDTIQYNNEDINYRQYEG